MIRALSLLISSLLIAPASPALAQDARYPDGRTSLYLGWFITDRDTQTRFDSDSGTGTDIQMEGDLGLESTMTVARLGGHFWAKPRHRLDFSLFDLSRTASRQIDETIEFGDETFVVDTTVHSTFDFEILKADYTFAALRRTEGFVGITAGLYITSFKLGLSEATLGSFESEELTAPLPVIGVRGDWRITDRISVLGYAQWFKLEVDDTGGRLSDYLVGAEYQVSRRFDLGIAYNDVSMRIDADEPDGLTGQLIWDYDGWILYGRATFGRSE